MFIDRTHPLSRFFRQLVWRRVLDDAQVHDPTVGEYVSGLLADFARVDNLYKIRNARGQRLEDVGEMLIESNPLLQARSFMREREVRKHIGDFTLFFAGVFPESLAHLPRRRPRLDAFVDYIKTGKESYAVVASFDQFEYRNEAPLFRRLSERFEQLVYGLNLVKQDLERFQQGHYRRLQAALIG